MRVSMLDAPGHETLMATAIAGSSIIDAILFVIAANEPCPMQQTREHLMIINILGIKNVIIVQTKIDIVGKETALQHEKQIREFIKGSVIENAPIIPVMPNLGINIDVLLEMIANIQDTRKGPGIRSVDVRGEVVRREQAGREDQQPSRRCHGRGDSVREVQAGGRDRDTSGHKHHEPGAVEQGTYKPAITTIASMNNGTENVEQAVEGGLVGICTEIDPSFVKADRWSATWWDMSASCRLSRRP